MSKPNNLQEIILGTACRESRPVEVIVINGYHLKGRITAFDHRTVVLESEGRQMMVCKHAISTIIPEPPVLPDPREEAFTCQN